MNNKINTKINEIGSYFQLENNPFPIAKKHNLNYHTFYTGRHALLFILNHVTTTHRINKIWFPNYYCQHTLYWIKKTYPILNVYEVNPFEFSKVINISDFAGEEDVVLVNNYWGLSSMPEKKNKFPIVIEDHSHGWLTKSCLNSKADYCFVSLRKSLPIPLGGIFWRPHSHAKEFNLDFEKDIDFYKIWDKMLEAMKLKSAYLNGDSSIKSSTYLPLFYEVEEHLNNTTHFVHLKNNHFKFIDSYMQSDILKYKSDNLNFLYSKINENPFFKIVKREGFTAFGLHLIFQKQTVHNDLKSYLVKNNIFPSSLWPDNNIDYEWQYFLNIHVDFRYSIREMNYIISKLNNWSLNYKC